MKLDSLKSAARNSSFALMILSCVPALTPLPASAQSSYPQTGQMVLKGLTMPRGGAWLEARNSTGAAIVASGQNQGHLWVSDALLGFCRVDPSPTLTPPFTTSNCQAAAKSGGQAIVVSKIVNGTSTTFVTGQPAGGTAGTITTYVFVADNSSKSQQVVRYVFDPVKEQLGGALPITIPNTQFQGGTGAGRPVAVALAPNFTDLYVGYVKSSDIARLRGATSVTSGTPPACGTAVGGVPATTNCYELVGSTSDGRKGVNAIAFFRNDLYLAETGGPSLTVIPDPSGLTRTACSSAAKCAGAVPPGLPSGIPSFPGGMSSDATFLYIADAPLNTAPGAGIVAWNVATGQVITLSQNITPSYSGTVDGTTFQTYTQYASPIGIIAAPNGDVYVGDDPSFRCAGPTCPAAGPPTTQGHVFTIPFIPAAPMVTGLSPNVGAPQGGTVVSIQGTNFSIATGGTTVTFGGLPATTVSCTSVTQCTATSPAGTGTVDVVVTANGLGSAITSADKFAYQPVTVTGISPTSGPLAGGTPVTITGTGFPVAPAAPPVVNFGTAPATGVTCPSSTTCTAVSPAATITGAVQVTVTIQAGTTTQTSNTTGADQFTYVAPTTLPAVISVTPNRGFTGGGTTVTITGSNLTSPVAISFGANPATNVACNTAGTSCTMPSPATTTGIGAVHVLVTANGQTSIAGSADAFTYANPTASVFAFGITAPKGGMLWVPKDGGGGHWWSSDHANGFCRQDPVSGGGAPFAMNYAACDDGSIGSPGQAVYDARPAVCQAGAAGPCHYIYVPDNAVKSTAVWRLTFDSATETIVGTPEAMIPLADVRTLKPNGMALGPDGSLYITDLTEMNIRRLTGPSGDPRLQTISVVAVTGDARGANGTIGFIGSKLYISENRAASWFDITQCPTAIGPCATTPLPLPPGVFVAGVATDAKNGFVYAADSPGGSPATIWRYNLATNTMSALYLQGGTVPTLGPSFNCAQTCTRPTDALATSNAFSFAFGIVVDPNSGNLMITEDATAGARSGRGRAWMSPFLP